MSVKVRFTLSFDSFKKCVHVQAFCLHIYLYTTYMPSPTQVRRGCQSPGTGALNGCELDAHMWMLGIGP